MKQQMNIRAKNYWYEQYQQEYALQVAIPTGATFNQNREEIRRKSLAARKWPIPVMVLSVVTLVALAMGLYFILRPSTAETTAETATTDSAATTDSTQTTLIWPYGTAAGDASYMAGGTISYTPDAAVTGGYAILGFSGCGLVTVELFCKQGNAFVSPSDRSSDDAHLTIYSSKPLFAGYDDPDPSQERYCYHRMTNSAADKDRLCALIAGFSTAEPYEAYVFTWVNYTYGGGTKIGTFQMILVFSDAKTYLIRIYDDLMDDITGVSHQFSAEHYNPDLTFETATMAADVRDQREVFDLTGSSSEPNLDDAAPGDGNSCN